MIDLRLFNIVRSNTNFANGFIIKSPMSDVEFKMIARTEQEKSAWITELADVIAANVNLNFHKSNSLFGTGHVKKLPPTLPAEFEKNKKV